MAETDMKALSELDLYNNLLDYNSLLPMTVNPNGSNITRRVYYPSIATQISGYDILGTLTAGSTSITLSSTGTTYNEQNDYNVGDRVTFTGDDEVVRNYICIKNCTKANWQTNGRYFTEYVPINGNSNVDVYTKSGGNPYVATTVLGYTLANNAITLTFAEQTTDLLVKVRVT